MEDRKFTPFVLVAVLVAVASQAFAQGQINWVSWEEAVELNQREPRKIVVDVYTEWCGWCKKMDKATFQNEQVAAYVNENYYAIKFDAEQKEEIRIHDKVYKYVKSGRKGYHELSRRDHFRPPFISNGSFSRREHEGHPAHRRLQGCREVRNDHLLLRRRSSQDYSLEEVLHAVRR